MHVRYDFTLLQYKRGNFDFSMIIKSNRAHKPGKYFCGNFSFLCDEEYREERGAKRHLGTLGAEKLKFTKKN